MMVGRRKRLNEIGGGVVSQMIGHFEPSRNTQRATANPTSDEHVTWSGDSSDSNESRNLAQSRLKIKLSSNKRVHHKSSQNDFPLKRNDDDLDEIIMRSSSSGSNGASEWFQALLEEAISIEHGATKEKRECHVSWKNENQEHYYIKEGEDDVQNSMRSQRRSRSEQSQSWAQLSADFRTSLHYNDLDAIPPRLPSKVPRSLRNPVVTGNQPSGDWDFHQQIFPPSSSFLDSEMAPTPTARTDSSTKSKKTLRKGPIPAFQTRPSAESMSFTVSRSSERKSRAERVNIDPPERRSALDAPNLSSQPVSFLEVPFSSSLLLQLRKPSSSSSSRRDPDGVVLDTNSLEDMTDDSAIHNMVLPSIYHGVKARQAGQFEGPNCENSPRSTWIPVSLPAGKASRHDPSPGDVENKRYANFDRIPVTQKKIRKSPEAEDRLSTVRSTRDDDEESSLFSDLVSASDQQTKCAASKAVARIGRSYSQPSQDTAEMGRSKVLSSPSKGSRSSKTVARIGLDTAEMGRSKVVSSPSTGSRSSKTVARIGHSYSQPSQDTAEMGRSKVVSSPLTGSRSLRPHKVTFAADSETHSNVSLLDAMSSSESDCEEPTSNIGRTKSISDSIHSGENRRQIRKHPSRIATAPATPTNEDGTFTPLVDNRSREGNSSFSKDRLSRAPQAERQRAVKRPSVKPLSITEGPQSRTVRILPCIQKVKSDLPTISNKGKAPFPSLISVGRPASYPSHEIAKANDSESLTSGSRSSAALRHHPPFSSVRDTVASSHYIGAPDHCKSSTAISVGEEKDKHRPFTSVRGTVAPSNQKFHRRAVDLVGPSSLVGRRVIVQDDRESRHSNSEVKPSSLRDPDSDDGNSVEKRPSTPSGAEGAQTTSRCHTRDYWKSIRALKTLGSFDSVSHVSALQRKARKSQEFIGRQETLSGSPSRVIDALPQRNEEKAAIIDQHFSSRNSGGMKQDVGFERNTEKSEPTPTLAPIKINSKASPHTYGNGFPSFTHEPMSGWNGDNDSMTLQRHQEPEAEQNKQLPAINFQRLRATGPRPGVLTTLHGDRDRLSIPPPRSPASRTLLSKDSEGSFSESGTTIDPAAACCSFTVGDLSWGMEWLRFKKS